MRDAGLAVRERVIWNGGKRLRSTSDVLRWPFERVAWAFERTLVWPLEERVGGSSLPLRSGAGAAAVLLAAGAGVLGLVLVSGGNGTTTTVQTQRPPAIAVVHSAPETASSSTPALQGATPDFTPDAAGKASTGSAPPADGEEAGEAAGSDASVDTTTTFSTASASSSASAKAVPAGPAAMKVARRFAGAFVLYETGRSDPGVRTAFGETASPRLARALLQRPPRLPADAKVPKAKVVNIVPGPRHGSTHTLSVSLLRVGITSELRIDVARDEKSGEWQVTDVLG